MSRTRKPARLWLRPADKDREAVWIILDGGKQYSTGRGESDRAEAERALAEHIAKRFLEKPTEKHRAASEVSVAEVIAHYLLVKEETVRNSKELAARAKALLAFWGDKTLDDITTTTCSAYVKQRTSQSMARRELEDLRAACRMAIADKVTRHAVTVTLPPKSKGRTNHLDRDTMAKLVWAAYRKREVQRGVPTKKKATLHVARFLIAALYTGSRSARVWQASFKREKGRPYIDLEHGVYYRAAEDEQVAANKQAPPIRLPSRLLAHMRRWHRNGAKYVVEYQGRAADPKRAFRNLTDDVLGDEAKGIVRHTMRHTAATWLMQGGVDMWQAAGYLGMTKETLEKTYGHHHPDHQGDVGDAFTSGRAGRIRQ
ncbi:MAG: integrase [Mesorhizobium sp.]|uniref:integrase n=1 Tax=Mesorhizobium sp. TaxID=1871066 RepID=UPI000FE66D0A|nr:integrase [Mesorhizobium sp.]RWD62327.1 MAG: integrase [Mesorhizobium sp.]RWE46920.1 MAG: integrase [Mesorhizobium sp.]